MIVDCFTFFNELDILELRLTILDRVVDRFVVCEAPFTFRGEPKALHFERNRARFARWNDRIVHLVYDGPPDANPWNNEWGQRAHLTSALHGAAPGDVILIGDVDEIPAPDLAARTAPAGRVLAHRHLLSVGYVNRVTPERWLGTKAVRYGDLGGRTLNDIRLLPLDEFDAIDSGWHLSALGGPAVMAKKLHAYAHAEADIPYFNDPRRLEVQFASEWDAHWVPLDDSFPAIFRDARWAPYVLERAPLATVDEALAAMHAHGCFGSVPPSAAGVGALVTGDPAVWRHAGTERYGAAFAGAFETADALTAAVPAGGWAVIDGLERRPAAELHALEAHGLNLVAYARNARSYAAINPVLFGAPFPAGRPLGRAEMEAEFVGAGFGVERRDAVRSSLFAPQVLERPEPFEAMVGPFRFPAATRAALEDFATDAYVFTLRPIRLLGGTTP